MTFLFTFVNMHCIFFVHSSVGGHLGFSHLLTTVSSAAMNVGVPVPLQIIVSSGYMPRSGVAGSYWQLYFQLLEEPPSCSLEWLRQFTFPPTVYSLEKVFYLTHLRASIIISTLVSILSFT